MASFGLNFQSTWPSMLCERDRSWGTLNRNARAGRPSRIRFSSPWLEGSPGKTPRDDAGPGAARVSRGWDPRRVVPEMIQTALGYYTKGPRPPTAPLGAAPSGGAPSRLPARTERRNPNSRRSRKASPRG